jgi:predicted HAD superfamily Cof-like phosphohydrolase
MTGPSNFEDVGDFHRKFDLRASDRHCTGPMPITDEYFKLLEFRVRFMQEELDEFIVAATSTNHAEMFDALIDLVYVAMGTAHLFGYPWQEGWDEVQRANMEKMRATKVDQSARGGTWDVVKPLDWKAPNIADVLVRAGFPITIQDQLPFED